MKILVFSDSHRSLSGMYAAIDLHQPRQVIHLGDVMDDAEEVAGHYPALPFCLVPGNCDGWGVAVPVKKQITLGGRSILLFGHTHIPLCRQLEDGLWMMNPGPARSSYGLIEITDGTVACSLHQP